MSEETVKGWVEGDEWYPVACFREYDKDSGFSDRRMNQYGKAFEFPKVLLDRYRAAKEAFCEAEDEVWEHWYKLLKERRIRL